MKPKIETVTIKVPVILLKVFLVEQAEEVSA